jgi:exodeoxyribonuclease VII small subunit
MTTKKANQQDLSEAFGKLEKIAEEFEKGEVDLEEGIAKLEKGLELAAFLKKQLSRMENKVTKIKEKYQEIDD